MEETFLEQMVNFYIILVSIGRKKHLLIQIRFQMHAFLYFIIIVFDQSLKIEQSCVQEISAYYF
jgi:hypothetical protein